VRDHSRPWRAVPTRRQPGRGTGPARVRRRGVRAFVGAADRRRPRAGRIPHPCGGVRAGRRVRSGRRCAGRPRGEGPRRPVRTGCPTIRCSGPDRIRTRSPRRRRLHPGRGETEEVLPRLRAEKAGVRGHFARPLVVRCRAEHGRVARPRLGLEVGRGRSPVHVDPHVIHVPFPRRVLFGCGPGVRGGRWWPQSCRTPGR